MGPVWQVADLEVMRNVYYCIYFFFKLLHYKEKLLQDKVVVMQGKNERDSSIASLVIGID